MTAYLRLAALVATLLGFVLIGIPVQALAVRQRWSLARRIPCFFHRTMCRILRLRVRVSGRTADTAPQILVANHVSWVDILAISTLGQMYFLAKKEVRGWPIFGTFAMLQGSVFVDRARVSELPKVNAELAGRMLAGDQVVLFAESTTGDGIKMLRFRAAHFGAIQTLLARAPEVEAVLILPVAIRYVSRDGRTGVAWHGDMKLVPHIWTLLRGGPYDCDIGFGAPIRFGRDSSRRAAMLTTEAAVGSMLALSRCRDKCEDASSSLLLFGEKP